MGNRTSDQKPQKCLFTLNNSTCHQGRFLKDFNFHTSFRMNPSVISVALQAYSDAAETVLRIALHELPPPGQQVNPKWETIKNPVATLKVNCELMQKITEAIPDLHRPKYMVILQPNLHNLFHILNQVNPLTPLCKLRTIFVVQKQLKSVVDLIKRTFIFPDACGKLNALIKDPKFSIVFGIF